METLQYQKLKKANKSHDCNYCDLEISKGDKYFHSVHKSEGRVYTWKSHSQCQSIASELRLFDDEGLTGEDFQECIKNEYQKIMSDHFNEEYESKSFTYPKFKNQLLFVINFHNKLTTQ